MVVEVDSGGRGNRYKTKEGKQNTVSGRGAVDRTLICAGGIIGALGFWMTPAYF